MAFQLTVILPKPGKCIFNTKIIEATSVKALCIAPGIYTSPPNNFKTLAWFINQNMKIDKPSKAHLLRYLTTYDVTTITVI